MDSGLIAKMCCILWADAEFWPLLRMTDPEKAELIRLIEAGEPLPERWRGRLFPDTARAPEVGKEYRLVYDGKMKREEVLATTPAAPSQHVRSFCEIQTESAGHESLMKSVAYEFRENGWWGVTMFS